MEVGSEISETKKNHPRRISKLITNEAVSGRVYDFKWLPVNEQITEERGLTDAALRRVERDLDKGLFGSVFNPRKRELRETNERLKERIEELDKAWVEEDTRLRKESGADWDELNRVLSVIDISKISPEKLVRKRESAYYQVPEAEEKLRLFGNIVVLNKDEFEKITKSLSLEVKRRVRRMNFDRYSGMDHPNYWLVATASNWQIVREAHFETPGVSEDESYHPSYWEGTLLPHPARFISDVRKVIKAES